jgi:hypothetical protein
MVVVWCGVSEPVRAETWQVRFGMGEITYQAKGIINASAPICILFAR